MSRMEFSFDEKSNRNRNLDGRELPIALRLGINKYGLVIQTGCTDDIKYRIIDPKDGFEYPSMVSETIPELILNLKSFYPDWEIMKGEIRFYK